MIGYEPYSDELVITKGQAFSAYLSVTAEDPFPENTSASLYMYSRDGQTQLGFWPATLVEEGGAQFQIDADDLNGIPDGARFRVYVTYEDSVPTCWYRGPVWRKD